MHELEEKIAAWRTQMATRLPGHPETVRELEEHLRDEIAAMTSQGTSPIDAFARAVAQLGEPTALAREFRRAGSRWFGGVYSREARLLACMSGVMSIVLFVFYLFVFVRNGLWLLNIDLIRSRVPVASQTTILFYQMLFAAIFVACALVMRASRRMLTRPTANDLRGVVSFNLLVIWMLGAEKLLQTSYRFGFGPEAGILMSCGLFAIIAGLWAIWMRRVEGTACAA